MDWLKCYRVCWQHLITGYCDVNDEVYQATRRTILSPENPVLFHQGDMLSGLRKLPYLLSLYLVKRRTKNDVTWFVP